MRAWAAIWMLRVGSEATAGEGRELESWMRPSAASRLAVRRREGVWWVWEGRGEVGVGVGWLGFEAIVWGFFV